MAINGYLSVSYKGYLQLEMVVWSSFQPKLLNTMAINTIIEISLHALSTDRIQFDHVALRVPDIRDLN